ncbi:MAG: hypothetical protein U5K69_23440 [Balneolaceae bacterium]|nr:hypothetical protein [Balneolaceae bacterium]
MKPDGAARFTLAVDELLTDMILFAYPDRDGKMELSPTLQPVPFINSDEETGSRESRDRIKNL